MSVADAIIAGVVVFAMFFMLLFFFIVTNSLINSGLTSKLNAKDRENVTTIVKGIDYVIPVIYFGIIILAVLSSFNIVAPPFFYAFVLFFLLIASLFSGVLQNLAMQLLYTESDNELLDQFKTEYPFTSFVVFNLQGLSLLGIVVISLAVYGGGHVFR